jgi:hypothetical protein
MTQNGEKEAKIEKIIKNAEYINRLSILYCIVFYKINGASIIDMI